MPYQFILKVTENYIFFCRRSTNSVKFNKFLLINEHLEGMYDLTLFQSRNRRDFYSKMPERTSPLWLHTRCKRI